ncbi:Neurotransmitter-gated ion-channel ligand binding domain family protein [Brugia pahangi]
MILLPRKEQIICWNRLILVLLLSRLRYTGAFTTVDCMHRYNVSDLSSNDLSDKLEDCIYYFLVGRAKAKYGDIRLLYLEEPTPKDDIFTIIISHVAVRRVELTQKFSSQFTIYGDLYVSWEDERLKWDKKEWQLDEYTLHDAHHIWKPTINDEYYLGQCNTVQGCYTTVQEIDIFSSGKVVALYSFHYPAFCNVNYYRYPEEENDCCLFFSLGDLNSNRKVHFELKAESKATISQVVKMERMANGLINPTDEHSAWMLEHRTVAITKMSGSNFELLHVCIHARKQMSTLRIALRLPVSITTMLMLASPLFGHLTTQIYVKLFAFSLQTVSFIFLCSISPENGFGKTKPKIYTFFETIVVLTVISIMVNMIAIALSRVRRTIPPRHNFYLASKVINHLICCIEPDPTASYFRHLDDYTQTNFENSQPDYTTEWRHIYIASNNLFSAFALIAFIIVAVFEIL